MHTNRKTVRLTQLALLAAIEVLLAFTPLGFIPLPAISITTLHIPVIIGAVLLGPADGAILGGVMGICSMLKATFAGTDLTSVLINPFMSGNPLASVIMTIGSRIMIGVVAGVVYRQLSKRGVATALAIALAALAGTLTNTVLFLGFMSIFFKTFPLVNILGIVIGVNAVSEIIAAMVISVAVCIPVMRYMRRKIVTSGKRKNSTATE